MKNKLTKPAISQYIVNRFKDIAGERATAIRNIVYACDEVKRTKMRKLINDAFRKWSTYHYEKPYWFEDAAFHLYFEVVNLVKTYVDPGFDRNYRMWLY